MVQIFRHKALTASFEAEEETDGIILHHLMIAAIPDHLLLESGDERRLAPAKLSERVVARRIAVKQPGEICISRQSLLEPAFQAVVAELAFEEGSTGRDGIGVPQLARRFGHLLAGDHFANPVRYRGIFS